MARLLLNATGNSNRIIPCLRATNIERRTTVHTILNRLDRLMMAITFAEANEPELTRECLGKRKPAVSERAHQTPKMTGGRIVANHTAQ